ncbi:MAG: 50S ribosomal protein L11 methyltransferase [Acidobacteriota bacterium]|nr:50S ribosomal protein L11 methyltransferase [Acidobacteriota bacterium]
MNMKLWYAVEVEIARVGETAATTQLWAMNTTGLEVSEDAADFVTLRAYFDAAPDVETLRQNILNNLKLLNLTELALRRIEASTLADQDWMSEWKKGWEPLLIGQRLVIAPSWKLDQVPQITDAAGRVVIQIDPGMAFGTGTHETTRGCLELLEHFWPLQTESPSLLDVGTGTGILAIAAVKLSPDARITAFDVDPEAIEVARENAEINQVADAIEIEVNKLSSYADQEFDVVLANLTADVIIPLAADFPAVMKPQSVLIVSGILREQGADVTTALTEQPFELIESKPDGEWVSMAFRLKI